MTEQRILDEYMIDSFVASGGGEARSNASENVLSSLKLLFYGHP
jgi:hypothetical protein